METVRSDLCYCYYNELILFTRIDLLCSSHEQCTFALLRRIRIPHRPHITAAGRRSTAATLDRLVFIVRHLEASHPPPKMTEMPFSLTSPRLSHSLPTRSLH